MRGAVPVLSRMTSWRGQGLYTHIHGYMFRQLGDHLEIIKTSKNKITCVTHHHPSVCTTTCPQPLPHRVLHTVRSRASSFNLQYPLISLRSPSSCLRLLPRRPVTYIPPSIFPLIVCFRRQYLERCDQSNYAPFFLLYVGYSSAL
jgi:hypothetical protein